MNSKTRKFMVQLKVGGLVSVTATHFRYDRDLGDSISFFNGCTHVCSLYAHDVAFVNEFFVEDPFNSQRVLTF